MPTIPIPLQSAPNSAEPATGERLINLYAEPLTNSQRTDMVLHSHPGMRLVLDLGETVRGLEVHRGVLYAAAGSSLYRINLSTLSASAISAGGAVEGTQAVILYNGIDFYCTAAGDAAYVDGYFLRRESAYAGRFAWAGPYSSTWDALDFATAEGDPDALVAIAVAHREVWLFGQRSTEVWYNSGNVDLTFERVSPAFIETGARGGVAVVGPTLYWLGDDGIVYRANGYVPERVSTYSVEQRIAERIDEEAIGFEITLAGHNCYVLRLESLCLIYDATTQLWHERQSWNGDVWGAIDAAIMDGTTYVAAGKGIYALDAYQYTDDYPLADSTLERRFVTPPIFAGDGHARMASLELNAVMGIGLATGQGSEALVQLRWSDDGGRTWSNWHTRRLGEIGEYKTRARWRRLGRFRERSFELRITDPITADILSLSGITV